MKPRLCVAIAAACLASCSLEPVYTRPAAPVSSQFPTGAAYKDLAHPGALPAADIGWRDFLGDPRLQRLVQIALENNRDLRVAALNVQQARDQYRIQRAALMPSVAGFAQHTAARDPTTSAIMNHSEEVGLSASWEIDFFGRLRSLSHAALDQYFATEEARRATQILLVSQVADQYLTMLSVDDQLAVTRQTLASAQASYKIVKLQVDTGTANALALEQAQSVVDLANTNLDAQIRLRAQAENALVLLLGEPLPAELPPGLSLDNQKLLADIPAGLPSDLLERRPDILQAEAQLRAENADIGAARADFFPNVSLTASLGTASTQLSGLFGAGSLAWTFLPSLTLPIFEGGALRANLDAATVQKDIGVAQYQKAIQTAFREVADGLAARGTYDDQLAAQERYTDTQQRSLDLALSLYKNGIDDYLQVLTAQTSLYSAQLTLVTTRLARLTSLVDLYQSLGGGWLEQTGQPAEKVGVLPAKLAG